MSAAVVFLDTETTGLSLDDDIWEFAAVRREEDGAETEFHAFVEHSEEKCRNLPEAFFNDHRQRFPSDCSNRVTTRRDLAYLVRAATRGAHVIGAVPNFDTERLARLMAEFTVKPEWHYHLIDVETLAVGYLFGEHFGSETVRALQVPNPVLTLPWDSNKLSEQVGVNPDDFPRHTAMGDVRWAMAIYDAVTKGLAS